MWDSVVHVLTGALLVIVGFFGGGIVASGYFSLLVKLGIVTRMSARTKTAAYSRFYEDILVLGAGGGNLFSLFQFKIPVKWLLTIPYGFFTGIFVGCLAIALAEVVDAFPIFSRRIRLRQGLRWIVTSLAVGKMLGAFFQMVVW